MINKEKLLNEIIAWAVIAFLISFSCLIFFIYKSSEEIMFSMRVALYFFRPYTVLTHVIFLTILVEGLIFKRVNDELYAGIMAFFAITTAIIGIIFILIPEIIFFTLIFVLTINAYFNKELTWDLKKTGKISRIFAIISFTFGFWYLFWVESPIWVNAIFLSPLGILNSPTLLTICGFLCINNEPRSNKLELVVAIVSLWIGIINIIIFGIYVDIVLLIVALFLIIRFGYYISKQKINQNQV
ncbi:MAG: hypothetical protein ACFFDK_00400 [Promethearchaeota archaeon]